MAMEAEWKYDAKQRQVLISIFTADGTRTSILQITGLSVSDAAEYTCEVRRRGGGEYIPRTQTLNLPGMLNKQCGMILGMIYTYYNNSSVLWRGLRFS